jgi:hypothetical protein
LSAMIILLVTSREMRVEDRYCDATTSTIRDFPTILQLAVHRLRRIGRRQHALARTEQRAI